MTANPARLFAVALTLLLVAIPKTWAADQTITLRLGIGSPLALERSFKAVLIGDPDVVDVHTRNDRSVMLEPLNPVAKFVQGSPAHQAAGAAHDCNAMLAFDLVS